MEHLKKFIGEPRDPQEKKGVFSKFLEWFLPEVLRKWDREERIQEAEIRKREYEADLKKVELLEKKKEFNDIELSESIEITNSAIKQEEFKSKNCNKNLSKEDDVKRLIKKLKEYEEMYGFEVFIKKSNS